ncbi:MAG: nucleotidyltransferase family protein [Azonexus sp.]|jgi:predicted nucleotidyltransferase|nr:nucleotidyltransferase family protein [Betaproteobacteria bacterium]MBK8918119.1 nucleotidyltransferase family protein [Betaproteobacteria bacterium]MBP6035336.1 nucleotidyltransferase family protein [Azonexus sp.]MBP6906089.1 nucleotidyltransferase family protein [Azonexus sp.]
MDKTTALQILIQSKPVLAERFGVRELALFGSTAGDRAGTASDIDVLVTFDGPASSARYFGVQFYLEDILGCPVDLVTDKALRPELRPFVEREAIRV